MDDFHVLVLFLALCGVTYFNGFANNVHHTPNMQQKSIQSLVTWSCSGTFFSLTFYNVYDLFYKNQDMPLVAFSKYMHFKELHRFFPLFISTMMLASYFLVVSQRGYIDTFFDVEGNNIDEEELMREIKFVKVKKVYYIRYLSLLFSWPVLIFMINKDSVLDLVQSALYTISIFVAIELLISVMLICSFKSQWQKLVASIPLIFLQIFVLVLICMHNPELTDNPLLFVFYFSWVGYTMTWVCCEVLNAINESSRDIIWCLLDLIQFALIPALI